MHTKNAHKKLGEAIEAAGKCAAEKAGEQADPTVSLETTGRKRGELAYGAEGEQVQFAIVQDESGWPMVKADREFVLSDDRKEWGKQIRNYIRDEIRRNGELRIKTLDGDELILDAKSQEKAKDWLSIGNDEQNQARKNASAHLDEVVAVSEDVNPDGPNVPDNKSKHDWSKDGWRYREAIFEDYSGKRYLLTISVGVEGENKTVYNIGNVDEIKRRTSTSVNGQPGRVPGGRAETLESPAHPRISSSYNISVTDPQTDVNTQSMQDGIQLSLAPNQFANETIQRLSTFSEETKAVLAGRTHEVVPKAERMDAAWQAPSQRRSALRTDGTKRRACV